MSDSTGALAGSFESELKEGRGGPLHTSYVDKRGVSGLQVDSRS